MNRRLVWFVMALMLGLGITACGGGDDDSSGGDSAQEETATAQLLTLTPNSNFPPTWTPAPTQPTATPRPTVAYTYVRPTQPTVFLPTRTLTPAPPTETPVPTRIRPTLPVLPQSAVQQALTLDLTTAILNEAGKATYAAGTLSYLLGAPGFNFQAPDTVIVLGYMQTDADNEYTAANLVIRATVTQKNGRIVLTQAGTNILGDTKVVQQPLVDEMLDTLEGHIATVILEQLAISVPGTTGYEITAVEVKETSITIAVNAKIQSGAQGEAQVTPTPTTEGPVG